MANLLAVTSGDFTDSSVWGVVEYNYDVSNGVAALGTSNVDSSTFVPGAITVAGVAIKCGGRAASPAGTFTVTLRNSTAGTNAASVTINVSDLHVNAYGWAYFEFSSPVLLAASDNYVVRLVNSNSGSQTSWFTDGSGNNWARKLVGVTTAAPSSDDHLVVCGKYTGTGASTTHTVTMDNTATTSFAPTVSGGPPEAIVVSSKGVMTWDVTASTNFYLKWKGIFQICGGGIVNIGTSGARMPASSTATLKMDVVGNNDSALRVHNGGLLNIYGAVKNQWSYMTVDKAVSATVITVADTTGWEAGDVVVFPPTINTGEERTILSVDSSTQITLTAGLTYAQSGTFPTQCRVMNMTRNIKISGTANNLRGLFQGFLGTAAMHVEYLEVDSALMGGPSILLQTGASNSYYFGYNSLRHSVPNTQSGVGILVYNPSGKTAGSPCVEYNNLFGVINRGIEVAQSVPAAGDVITIKGNCVVGGVLDGDSQHFRSDTPFMQFTFNFSAGTNNNNLGMVLAKNSTTIHNLNEAEWADNEVCFSASDGLYVGWDNNTMWSFACIRQKSWRCGGAGLRIFTTAAVVKVIDSLFFGNGQSNNQKGQILFNFSCNYFYMKGTTLAADSLATASFAGVLLWDPYSVQAMYCNALFDECSFGVTSGIYRPFTEGDIVAGSHSNYVGRNVWRITARKCTFGSTTLFSGLTSSTWSQPGDMLFRGNGNYLRCQDWGNTPGDHRSFWPCGTIRLDTAIYATAVPSERVTPNTASYKMQSSVFSCPINSGSTKTFGAIVRKSTSGDGAAYTGSQPRLVLRANSALGLMTDTVLATYSAGTGSWNQLSGVMPSAASEDGVVELYIDCDGTAGWINVDDWFVTT